MSGAGLRLQQACLLERPSEGQVLHGSATTTEAIRRAIRHSEASLRSLAARYRINQETVAKWKRRTSVADVPTGDFLRHLVQAVPYKIHTVLTDNGIQFTTPGAGGSAIPLIVEALAKGETVWAHGIVILAGRSKRICASLRS